MRSTGSIQTGEITNSGIEVELVFKPINQRKFYWRTDFRFAYNKSVVQYFADRTGVESFDHFYWLEKGKEAGLMYAFAYGTELQNDRYIQEDVNGDGAFDFRDDAHIVGSAFPKYILGWQHSFNIHDLQIGLNFRSAIGHTLLNTYRWKHERNRTGTGGNDKLRDHGTLSGRSSLSIKPSPFYLF